MRQRIAAWLNRPLAEDFSWRYQGQLAAQAGLYVGLFILTLNAGTNNWRELLIVGSLMAANSTLASWLVNLTLPRLLPVWYDEDRWTVGRHLLHSLLVLAAVAAGNQLVLTVLHLPRPAYLKMYALVTVIGLLPLLLGVLRAEQRRLQRNLAQARQLNDQLNVLHQPVKPTGDTSPVAIPDVPRGVLLTGESGKDRLSLLPNQLIYVESVGNYVEVYWLNFMFPQKTVLRSTMKDVEAALAHEPQFFRCHRAFLVNLKAIDRTTGNSRGYQLTMSGSNRAIPVARTYVVAFNERVQQLAIDKLR